MYSFGSEKEDEPAQLPAGAHICPLSRGGGLCADPMEEQEEGRRLRL